MAAEFSVRARWTGQVPVFACVALLALPWLWPFTMGPTPNVVPLLVAWSCGLVVLLVVLNARSPSALLQESAARGWLLASLLSALIGLLQWFDMAPHTVLVNAAQLGEAYGNLRQKNQFASLTAIGLSVLVFRRAAALQPAVAAAVVLLGAGNALSASRTGLLEWLVIAVLAIAWPGAKRDRLSVCLVGLAGYAVTAVVAPPLLLSWKGIEATNVFLRVSTELGCSSRKVLWSNVLHLIAQKPWTGWGAGELGYAHYATLYDGPRFCDILDNAHNLPLHVAVEFGVPAAVLSMALVSVAVARGRPWRETAAPRQLAWAVLIVIGIHSLLEYPLWYGPFQWAVLVSLALLAGLRPVSRPRRLAATGLVAAGLAGIAFVAREYDTVSQAYLPPSERRISMRVDPVHSAGNLVLFRNQLEFAELSTTPLGASTAADVHAMALRVLHYSPEPMVIKKMIESATRLGRLDEAQWHAARLRAAFPEQYDQWRMGARTSSSPTPGHP